MDKLKIGDIKKFENGVTGVVVDIESRAYRVVSTDGRRWSIPFEMSYVSPRLKPEMRDLLNSIGNAKIDYEKARKAVSDAYIWSSKCNDRYESLIKKLETFGEEMSTYEFKELLLKKFNPAFVSLLDEKGYTVSVSYKANSGVTVEFAKNKVVCKYINPDNTPFVFADYDGIMVLETYSPRYKAALHKQMQNCLDFAISKPLISVSHEDFTVGDKHSLVFHHIVSCVLMNGRLDNQTADLIVNSIRLN